MHGEYSYTLETIIAAGQRKMAVASVPIRTNPDLRPSRLVKSVPGYVLRSAIAILRSFATYKPLRFFCGIGLAFHAFDLFVGENKDLARRLTQRAMGRQSASLHRCSNESPSTRSQGALLRGRRSS